MKDDIMCIDKLTRKWHKDSGITLDDANNYLVVSLIYGLYFDYKNYKYTLDKKFFVFGLNHKVTSNTAYFLGMKWLSSLFDLYKVSRDLHINIDIEYLYKIDFPFVSDTKSEEDPEVINFLKIVRNKGTHIFTCYNQVLRTNYIYMTNFPYIDNVCFEFQKKVVETCLNFLKDKYSDILLIDNEVIEYLTKKK